MLRKIISLDNPFNQLKQEYNSLCDKINAINTEIKNLLEGLRFFETISIPELEAKKQDFFQRLEALKPEISALIDKFKAHPNHEDYFEYYNISLSLEEDIDYEINLYSRIFDIIIINLKRGVAPTTVDKESITSPSIKRRQEIIAFTEASIKGHSLGFDYDEEYLNQYVKLLNALNNLEKLTLIAHLTDNKGLTRDSNVIHFASMLRCPGVLFYDTFKEKKGEKIPGFITASTRVLADYYENLLSYIEGIEDLMDMFDDNFQFKTSDPQELLGMMPLNFGVVDRAKYTGLLEFKENRLIVQDLHLLAPRTDSSWQYQEIMGDIDIIENCVYLDDKKIGQIPHSRYTAVGIESFAYLNDMKAVFQAETDNEGRLFLLGMPKYFQFPFNKNERIFIHVNGKTVTFKNAEKEVILTCCLADLRNHKTVTLIEDTNAGYIVKEYRWPMVPNTNIPIAAEAEDYKRIIQVLKRIQSAVPEIYEEMISRLNYIDLLTPIPNEGKIAEAYCTTRRIGISLPKIDNHMDQIMEALIHEVMGHIKLRDTFGPIAGHFGHTVKRGKGNFDKLMEQDFWLKLTADFDAEIVDEANALATHVEILLAIYKGTLSEPQQQRHTAYLEYARDLLELTMNDPKNKPSEIIQQFMKDLMTKIQSLLERVQNAEPFDLRLANIMSETTSTPD